MTPLERAAKAIDDYAGHASDNERPGTIPVPLHLLRALRKALEGIAK